MERSSKEAIQELVNSEATICVSISLPTSANPDQNQQNIIELKNLLRNAEEQLSLLNLRPHETQEILAPAHHLLQDITFWRQCTQGVALFLAKEFFRSYAVTPPEKSVVVSTHFVITPLLASYAEETYFHLVTLSRQQARLFQGTTETLQEIKLEGVAGGIEQALQYDDPERQLESHQIGAQGKTVPPVIFHGHGAGKEGEVRKKNLQRYLQIVDSKVMNTIADGTTPLVLAGTTATTAAYRSVTKHSSILTPSIEGNIDDLQTAELHKQSWNIVSSALQGKQKAENERYEQLAGTGQTLDDLLLIKNAAEEGRVELIWVANPSSWNAHTPSEKVLSPEDQDLLDTTLLHSWKTGAEIRVTDAKKVPGTKAIAAILRY